jgi:predicted ribosome quality control (RQC) complex YloA/Tae2 family protein
LTQKTASEQRLREENRRLKDAIRQLKEEKEASEHEHKEKVALLTEEVERMRRLAAQLRGKISSQALKTEIPKTPPRATPKPSKGQPQDKSAMDLSALVEVYKKMPDFTRPILQIDFSAYMPSEED